MWQDPNGTQYVGTNPQAQSQYGMGGGQNNWGLNPSNISTSYTPAQYGRVNANDLMPSQLSNESSSTTYNGPGGQWAQTGGGWQNSTGQRVGDLSGYLGMKSQQQQGADFSGYQGKLNNLLNDPNSVQNTPGYQYQQDQMNQSVNRSAAAKGMLNSGNVLAELQKNSGGLAAQNYNTQVNQLTGLMQGAQNFGVQSGYYQPPQNQGWSPMPYGGMKQDKPSNW